jgi:hypothetical protein
MYDQKYLKYKEKYELLKNLIGGMTYDIADEEGKKLAIKAMQTNGVPQTKIDSLFIEIANEEAKETNNKNYHERVNSIQKILKEFNEHLESIQSVNEHMEIKYNFKELKDNLPEHLPNLTEEGPMHYFSSNNHTNVSNSTTTVLVIGAALAIGSLLFGF